MAAICWFMTIVICRLPASVAPAFTVLATVGVPLCHKCFPRVYFHFFSSVDYCVVDNPNPSLSLPGFNKLFSSPYLPVEQVDYGPEKKSEIRGMDSIPQILCKFTHNFTSYPVQKQRDKRR